MDLLRLISVAMISATAVATDGSEQPVGRWRFDEDRGAISHDTAWRSNGMVHSAKWTGGTWFHGQMSDLRIYDKAISADQIWKVAADGRPQEPPPVADTKAMEVVSAVPKPSSATPWQWPQFRGPDRDGRTKETGLLKSWPKDGPRLLWHTEGLGNGYSSLSIADGLIKERQ